MPTIEDLKKLSLKTLRSEVSKTNIKNYSSLKKADLIVVMLKPEHIQRFHHLGGGVIEPPMPKKKIIIRKPKAEPATVPKKKIIIRKPVAEPAMPKKKVIIRKPKAEPAAMPKKKVIIRKRVPLNTVSAGDISDLGRGKVSTAKYIPSADETPAPKKVKIIKKTVAAPKKVKIIKKTKTTMKRLVVTDEPDSDDEGETDYFKGGKFYPVVFTGKGKPNTKKSFGMVFEGNNSLNDAVIVSSLGRKPTKDELSKSPIIWNRTSNPFNPLTKNKTKIGSWFFKSGIIFVDEEVYLKKIADSKLTWRERMEAMK